MNFFVKTPGLLTKSMKRIIWNVPNNEEKVLYLTFDDGPIPHNTEWILSVLREFDAKASFFCVGENVKNYPSLYELILKEGHTVGNHTYNHLNGWKADTANYIENVEQAAHFISSDLFRPPYGKLKLSMLNGLKDNYRLVMWDVLSRDFDYTVNPEQCYSNVIKNAKPGSVIVFHDNYKARTNLQYTLPAILKYYSHLGYHFAPLENGRNHLKKIRLTA